MKIKKKKFNQANLRLKYIWMSNKDVKVML